jgi:uncharacterized OB-fold protein
MTQPKRGGLRPILPFLKIPSEGEPYLEGTRCAACGATYLGPRLACSQCFERERLETQRLGRTGRLHVFSIVHRSVPGVETPYVSAIVDLDGGGTVKANLLGVEPDPARIRFDMPVELVTFVAPHKDHEGNEYLAFGFQPRRKE